MHAFLASHILCLHTIWAYDPDAKDSSSTYGVWSLAYHFFEYNKMVYRKLKTQYNEMVYRKLKTSLKKSNTLISRGIHNKIFWSKSTKLIKNLHQNFGAKFYFCLPLTWNSTIESSIMPTHRLGLCVCWMGYSKTWMTDDWTYRVQSPHKGAFPFLESLDGKLNWLSVENFLPNFNICT